MSDPIFKPKGLVPTDEQLSIQLERHKLVVVEANAGAAKTTTLALRLAQALERGADPGCILALTYTPAAVLALRMALERMGLPSAVRRKLCIQTFDEFCAARLLTIEGCAIGQYQTPEQLKPHVLKAIDRILNNADERYRDAFSIEGTGEGSVEGLLAAFEHLKGTMQLTLEASDRALSPQLADELGQDYVTLRVFSAYEHLRRGGHPDHHAFRAPNDATHDLAKLLLHDEAFFDQTHPLAMGLHLLLVDEMHDTNRAMFTVLQHLLKHNPAAFVGVGDTDQVIHAMAGAQASFMGSGFDQEIGPARRFPLTATYRFGPSLAQCVGQLSSKSYLSRSPRNTQVKVVACPSTKESNWHIASLIAQRVGLNDKAPLSDMAILLRQPHQSVELENHLLDQGVDYKTTGFDTYLMRPEVLLVRGLIAHARNEFAAIESLDTRLKVLQALLLFCGSHVESDEGDEDSALKQVVANPALAGVFIENQVLRNAAPKVRAQVEDSLNVLRSNATHILLEQFVQALRPHQLAARVMVRAADVEQVSANIQGLIKSAASFDNVASFFRAMNQRELRQKSMKGKDCVLMSSIEAAKGLEFEHVIIPGMNRGEFAVGGNTVDNRNLLYVGMTRARQQVTLLCDPLRPSQYLRDAGLM